MLLLFQRLLFISEGYRWVAVVSRFCLLCIYLAAVVVARYLGESFVAASSIPNITLQNPNNSGIFQLLVDNTIHFPITYIGILCTTISSALSYVYVELLLPWGYGGGGGGWC